MMQEDSYAYVVVGFQAPPSPNYVSGPEHPPLPEFVLEPVYPTFMPSEDEVFPAEEQPLPAAVSPTAESPGYIADSDPEEDPKEDPADGSYDDDDDDDVEEDEDEEEEEHPALADSIPPPHVHHVTARMSIREKPPTLVWSEAEINRILTIPSPSPSPLSLWSLPLPQIPLPPLPVSPHLLLLSPPLPASPTYPLGYRAAMSRLRAETPSTSHPLPSGTPPSGTSPLLPIPLPTPSPPLILLSTSHRADVPEVTLPPQRDRRDHARTARLMETEARLSRQAWVQFMDASDLARSEWSSHVTNVGLDVAYPMTWTNLRKKMNDKYCPRGEIKKLEGELWNLRVKSNDMVCYNQRFQELELLCVQMFPEESDKVKRYVGGLPDVIHGSVVALRSKTMQEAIEMATELMDKRNNTFVERQAENKWKSAASTNTANNQRGTWKVQKPTCFECGAQGNSKRECLKLKNNNNRGNQAGNGNDPAKVYAGHFRRECPKLKNNNNRGNQVRNVKTQAKVYAVGKAGANPNNNVVTSTFLLNKHYASILFDTGADRSFVSTAFSSRIIITPTALHQSVTPPNWVAAE
nr:hypothetical protein [Tanacetum cinerariifolium]